MSFIHYVMYSTCAAHDGKVTCTTVEYTTAYFGSAQNTQLLDVFFARTELLALAVVDSLVVVGQETEMKLGRPL